MGLLGSLSVSMRVDSATLASDLGKAFTMIEASTNQMAKAIGRVSDAFGTLASGIGVYQMISFGAGVIKAAADLEGLRAQTGLTITALSAMSNEGAKSGVGIDDIAQAFNRLEKFSALAVGGNVKAQQQFKNIGISAKQLAVDLRDPEKLMLDVSTALEAFNDDGYKSTAVMAMMGKGGAAYLEFLHNMAKDGYSAATATEEQVRQAHEFELTMTSLMTRMKALTLTLLTEFVPAMDVVTTTWQMRFANLWIVLKGDFDIFVLQIKDGLSFVSNAAESFASSTAKFFGLAFEKSAPRPDHAAEIQAIKDNAKAQMDANNAVAANEKYHYDGLDPITVSAKKILPSVPVTDPQSMKIAHGNDGLIKAMDERLKIFAAQMKAEDAIAKLASTQTDRDYTHGLLTLSDFGEKKIAILHDNFVSTQAIYGQEIAVAKEYQNKIAARLKVEQGTQVDPSQKDQMVAKIAATRAELDQTTSKISVLTSERAADVTKNLSEQLTLTDEMIAKSTDFAKSITDVDIAYATMIGNTSLANSLQDAQNDKITKAVFALHGLSEETNKLNALEEDRRMRSSQTSFDGMKRAVIDYQKGLADVAKATEAMTTKMLNGMEDALVSFVQTGKLNWRSLIDSMIADLIRMQIRAQVMPAISGWLSGAMGILGAFTGGGAAAVGGSMGGMMASGGPVTAGTSYTIGERGPEKFVPNVSGTIVPNSSNGAASIVYAPTIQIDSRSDRAQVQVDTARAVRQGQQELLVLLRRYNPGLKV